jgi:hypothetical protein
VRTRRRDGRALWVSGFFATDRFCFIHHDAGAATASRTCRDNGGLKITPGLDVASHLNVVTSFPATK